MPASPLTARDILDRLVAFPTISRDSNLPLIDFADGWLRGLGVEPVIVPAPCGTKAALYANVGPAVGGGVILSGHTDVVPVDGQDWATDPFAVTEHDGRLYGRGTADMKGFCALALAAVPAALQAGMKRPLQIALSYDEEVGCTGAPRMIAHMAAHGLPRAGAVIVGEPSMMQVVTGHKGTFGYHVNVKGVPVHSSRLPEGVSAIMEAARIIDWANGVNAALQAATPGPLATVFDPPFTTLHVGTITGGTAGNITASDCTFGFEIRVVPGEEPAAWEARFRAEIARVDSAIKARHPQAGITVTPLFDVPPLVPEAEGAAEALVRRLTGDNGSHVVSYGTEAGQFQQAGYSAVVCGPGDIAQAHKADEFITLEQFRAGEAFLARLIAHMAA